MSEEALDVSKIGIELLVTSIFIAIVVGLMVYGQRWYAKEEYYKYQTAYMNETADNWTFESRALKSEDAYNTAKNLSDIKTGMKVTGDDIVNFILRNDAKYNYYIKTKVRDPYVIKRGDDVTHYTEDYLLNKVGFGIDNQNGNSDGLSQKYYVRVIKDNDEVDGYIFTYDGKVRVNSTTITFDKNGSLSLPMYETIAKF